VSEEQVIWKGRPSQILNFWTFLACVLLAVAIVVGAILSSLIPLAALAVLPLAWAFWKFLVVRCRIYELTSQRLRMYEGVFNQVIDEIELYRVKDTTILRPFILRLFKLGNIELLTSDRTHHHITMHAIPDGVTVREHIRGYVETVRDQKRVREVDFDNADSDGGDDMEFGDEIG
jgi:membrane protein YdbS with pleckstrin-like domain